MWHSYTEPGECLDARLVGPQAIAEKCQTWTPRMHKVSYRAPDGRCWIGPPSTCDLPDGWVIAEPGERCGEEEWVLSGLCCGALPPT